MKAVVLHAYGPASSLRFEDASDPAPQAGEALVRIHAAGVNPVDWMLQSGAVRNLIPIDFPYILGIDMAGVVEAVGDAAPGFSVGDRVMALASHTYAELCVVKAEHLVRVPEGLDATDAAALPLVNLTGEQLVQLGAKAGLGDTVLVTGALGGVGRSAVFAAAEIGAIVIAGVRAQRPSTIAPAFPPPDEVIASATRTRAEEGAPSTRANRDDATSLRASLRRSARDRHRP